MWLGAHVDCGFKYLSRCWKTIERAIPCKTSGLILDCIPVNAFL